MKQTAVQWLYDQLPDHLRLSKNGFDMLQQAIEMEKEQIEKAFEEGMFHHTNGLCPNEYYNENY